MDDLSQRIETLMNEQKLFRSPGYTIIDLANELGSNRLYVSSSINQSFGMSFTRYINMKRIEFAINLMREYPSMSLDNVATESGFLSARTFIRKFKEIMNDTPKDYFEKNR